MDPSIRIRVDSLLDQLADLDFDSQFLSQLPAQGCGKRLAGLALPARKLPEAPQRILGPALSEQYAVLAKYQPRRDGKGCRRREPLPSVHRSMRSEYTAAFAGRSGTAPYLGADAGDGGRAALVEPAADVGAPATALVRPDDAGAGALVEAGALVLMTVVESGGAVTRARLG